MRIKKQIEKINEELELFKKNNQMPSNAICLDLKNNEIYAAYSNSSLLDSDIFEFIDNSYEIFKKNKIITINITYPDNFSNEEKNKIKHLIRVHYAIKYKNNKNDINKNKLIAFILLIIGIFLLTIYLVRYEHLNVVINSILEVSYWVFFWESCYMFAFSNPSKKIEMMKYYRLFNAEIIENKN